MRLQNDERSASFKNILIVDDDSDNLLYLSGILEQFYTIETAINGQDGIAIAQQIIPDLLLLDVMMPVMDGFEATRQIRQWERQSERESTPIIALTAHIMDEHKEQSLASGMNAHLAKPVEIHQLEATIRRWTTA